MMRILKLYLAFLITVSTVQASADGGDVAGAIIVSFVAARGLSGMQMDSLEALELPEWKEKRSQSTAELGNACGFQYEARLIGNARANFLWLSLKNLGEVEKSYNPIDTEFVFSDDTRRRPDLFRFDKVYLESGRLYGIILPFPDKENFAQQSKVTINFIVEEKRKPCSISIEMIRNPEVADTLTTTTTLNLFDMSAHVGRYNLSGDLADIGKQDGTFGGFNMNFFGRDYHGVYFSFYSYEQSKISNEYANKYNVAINSKLSLYSFNLGYTYRHFFKKNLQLYASLGIGALSGAVDDDLTDSRKELEGRGLIDLGLGYRYTFARVRSGPWIGNYFGGVDGHYFITNKVRDTESKPIPAGSGGSLGLHIGLGF